MVAVELDHPRPTNGDSIRYVSVPETEELDLPDRGELEDLFRGVAPAPGHHPGAAEERGVVARLKISIDDVLIFVDHIERSWRAALPPRLQEVLPSVAAAAARPALTVLVVALAIAAVWTPVRFSRWPLLNVVVAVAYLRLLVAVPRIAWVPWLESAVWRRAPSWVVDDRVLLMWAAMAIVLLIAAVALPSLTRWRHAMHYQENAT